jgi:hypothetical protein
MGLRDTGATLAFLDTLERVAARKLAPAACKPIFDARAYLLDKGALRKPLLENMVLTLPSVR